MKKVKSFLGYGWAALTILIVFATFAGNDYFSAGFASATGITISPWHSGGRVERITAHDAYRTKVHRPVFDGLISERKTGFVQIDWGPRAGLPALIEEEIDYNNDGKPDFLIRLDTKNAVATLTPHNPAVREIEHVYNLGKDGLAVRVALRRGGLEPRNAPAH